VNINPSIFKAYDIRGIYPQDLNEDNISQIVSAIYTFYTHELKKDPVTIVLSRDMRVSSPVLHDKTKEILVSLGAHVLDIGICPTTTYYFSILNRKADCGIQISASHNPKEYNGLKIVKRVGDRIVKIAQGIGMETVKEMVLAGNSLPKRRGGTVEDIQNAVEQEIAASIQAVKPNNIKKFKIVADAANAMGAVYLEELFNKIPADLIRMNFTLDGTFPAHQADPLQFKLFKDLQQRALAEKADLGIMPDGDGDRIFFVNEKAEIIPATLITALVTGELLRNSPGDRILVDIRYTRNVSTVVEKLGGKMSISKVGHALITDQLNREKGIFAGESSGHYYFRDTGGAESAVRVILHVLNVMSREMKPLSEILKQYHNSIESGETNFKLPEGMAAQQITDEIIKDHPDGKVDTLDGIAVSFPAWRFSIRSSNTEPLLRLNVEGETQELVDGKVKELTDKIISCGAEVV